MGARGGVTGYLDVLLHFALECTISGMGSQSEARFQAMLVRPGAMDHLPKEIKVNGKRSDLEWSPAVQREKCETWRKRDAH